MYFSEALYFYQDQYTTARILLELLPSQIWGGRKKADWLHRTNEQLKK